MSEEQITRSLTSASNLYQRELCPGSAFAEDGLPNADNDDSKEGTMLHAMDADPSIDRSELKLEQKEVLKAASAADDQIFSAVSEKMLIADNEPFIEGREDERWFRRGIKALFPGHNDRWRFYPRLKVLVIIDKKFGRKEVIPADANRQLMAYEVMGFEEFDADHVFVAINQPRLPAMLRVTIGEYNREASAAAKAHILTIWEGSHNKDGSPRQDAPRVAGEDQCRYCKAKLNCDAYRAKYVFLEKPSASGKDLFVEKLHDLTDDELDRVYVATRFAALISDSAKEEVLRRMENGGMTNYSQQPGGFTTTITDNAKAIELLQKAGLRSSEICRPVSLEALTEAAHEIRGGTQKDAKSFIKETLAPVIELKPKSPTLKRSKSTPVQPALL